MDFVKKVISSVGVGQGAGCAPNFPFIMEERILSPSTAVNNESFWSVYAGRSIKVPNNDGSKVAIFVGRLSSNPLISQALNNMVKRLRSTRHPLVLKFIANAETEKELFIATEPVTPLAKTLNNVKTNPDHLLWITFSLLRVIKFLNEEARMIHGNIRLLSIFLSSSGELRLGGFEVCSGQNDEESLITDVYRIFRDANIRDWPLEVSSPSGALSWKQLKNQSNWSIDSFMVAGVLRELFLESSKPMPTEITNFIKNATCQDPNKRIRPASLLLASTFKNVPLIEINETLENLALMDTHSREIFLKSVANRLDHLPSFYCCHKIVPLLIDNLLHVFSGDISLEGVRLLFKAASKLSQTEFTSSMANPLKVLFARTDRALRLVLLESIESITSLLDCKLVQESIYPAMIGGFTDSLPAIREATLKSSILIASKLTSRQLNGELLRFYARLQADEQPSLRVNAIVCLGRIANHLEPSVRSKVLAPAYTKALRDPFFPSRSSALAAIIHNIEFLSIEDIARNLLPAVSGTLIDPNQNTRNMAFKVAALLIRKLEEYRDSGLGLVEEPSSPLVSPTRKVAVNGESFSSPSSSCQMTTTSPSSSSTNQQQQQQQQKRVSNGWGISTIADKLMNTALGDSDSSNPISASSHHPLPHPPHQAPLKAAPGNFKDKQEISIGDGGWDDFEGNELLDLEIPSDITSTIINKNELDRQGNVWQDQDIADDNPWTLNLVSDKQTTMHQTSTVRNSFTVKPSLSTASSSSKPMALSRKHPTKIINLDDL